MMHSTRACDGLETKGVPNYFEDGSSFNDQFFIESIHRRIWYSIEPYQWRGVGGRYIWIYLDWYSIHS